VRSKVEDEVKREEMEIEQEEGDDEEVGGNGAMTARPHVKGPTKLSTVRAVPGIPRYKLVISSNKSATPIPKPTATTTVGRSVSNGGGGSARATVAASVPENQKLVAANSPNAGNPADSQVRGSNPQTNAGGSNPNPAGPVGQESMDRRGGDFIIALITQSYHKHRDKLLKLMESIAGD
jgi:hypothetical protein